MSNHALIHLDFAEIIDDTYLSLDELARLCGVTSEWVNTRVKEGILTANLHDGHWKFDSLSIIRARRILHLETTFDADPQLAALTADLIDEVLYLRQLMRQTNGR